MSENINEKNIYKKSPLNLSKTNFFSKKISFLFICFFFLSISVLGQYIIPVPANEKKDIADEIKALQKQTIRDGFSFESLGKSSTKLPPNYKGNPLKLIIKTLYNRYKGIDAKKEEFETTEEFNQRINKIRKEPLILGKILTNDSYFAFSKLGNSSKYNADSENFDIQTGFERINSPIRTELGLFFSQEVYDKPKELNSSPWKYPSSTLTDEKGTITKYGLSFDSDDLNTLRLDNSLNNINVNVPRAKAQIVKPYLAVLFIGKINFGKSDPISSGAVLAMDRNKYSEREFILHFKLSEIWVYNFKTGEIYLKKSTSQDF